MEHRAAPPDDVIVQVNAAAVAAVDERSSTSQIEEVGADDDIKFIGGGAPHRTFSESYRIRHRNPLVRTWIARPLPLFPAIQTQLLY
jgi:KUP system potassium uptake protein